MLAEDGFSPGEERKGCAFCCGTPNIPADYILRSAEDAMLVDVFVVGVNIEGRSVLYSNLNAYRTVALATEALSRYMNGGVEDFVTIGDGGWLIRHSQLGRPLHRRRKGLLPYLRELLLGSRETISVSVASAPLPTPTSGEHHGELHG